MKKRWIDLDPRLRHDLAEGKRKKRGKPSAQEQRASAAQAESDAFNARYAVGTPVRYWSWTKGGPGVESRTRSPAQVLGGHTAVVWVEGHASCISLTHVEAVQYERPDGPMRTVITRTRVDGENHEDRPYQEGPAADHGGVRAESARPMELRKREP